MSPENHTRHSPWTVWKNPIFRRYCQARLRLHGLGVSLLIIVLIAGFIVALVTSIGVRSHETPSDAARILWQARIEIVPWLRSGSNVPSDRP